MTNHDNIYLRQSTLLEWLEIRFKIDNIENVIYQANSLAPRGMFYVEYSHLDFLYVTVYETLVKLIRSENVNFVLERLG